MVKRRKSRKRKESAEGFSRRQVSMMELLINLATSYVLLVSTNTEIEKR